MTQAATVYLSDNAAYRNLDRWMSRRTAVADFTAHPIANPNSNLLILNNTLLPAQTLWHGREIPTRLSIGERSEGGEFCLVSERLWTPFGLHSTVAVIRDYRGRIANRVEVYDVAEADIISAGQTVFGLLQAHKRAPDNGVLGSAAYPNCQISFVTESGSTISPVNVAQDILIRPYRAYSEDNKPLLSVGESFAEVQAEQASAFAGTDTGNRPVTAGVSGAAATPATPVIAVQVAQTANTGNIVNDFNSDAVNNPEDGILIYRHANVDYLYLGPNGPAAATTPTQFVPLGGTPPTATEFRELITVAANGQTTFTLANPATQPQLSELTYGRIAKRLGVDYTLTGSTLTLTFASVPIYAGDQLQISYQ